MSRDGRRRWGSWMIDFAAYGCNTARRRVRFGDDDDVYYWLIN